MLNITSKDIVSLINELTKALMKFSNNKLSDIQAKKIAQIAIGNIDFNNSALAHKGLNWYAREIVDTIDFEAIV